MLDAFSFYYLYRGQKKDVEIEGKGVVVEVIFIEGNFHRYRQVIPAVYLRPPGNSGNKFMDPPGRLKATRSP